MKLKKIKKLFPNAYPSLTSDIYWVKDDEEHRLTKENINAYITLLFNQFHFYDGNGKLKNETDVSNRLFHAWELFLATYKAEIIRLSNAFNEEYAPLDNYDKYSTITTTDIDRAETTTGKVTSSNGASESETHGSVKNTERGTESTTSTIASFDDVSTNRDTSTTTYGTTQNPRESETSYNNYSISNSQTEESYTDYGDGVKLNKTGSTEVTEHTRGNIGVTTSSKMLLEFTQVRMGCNIYEIIARLYADMFLRL